MKKLFFFMSIMLMVSAMMFTGCSSCQSENKKQESVKAAVQADYDGVIVDFTAGVNHIVSLHRQTMYGMIKGNYEWRNLQVLFNDEIKAENIDNLHITDVTSVFYYWSEGPWVQYISSNVKKGTLIPAKIHDVWIEDNDMSNVEIKLSAEDVLKRLKEWNGIIPPSRSMILRLPIGPRRCNAQWVIGSIGDVIFVDAITGEITNWCPAFPIPNVNGPLGEWP
jgi:hypothetical protein